MIRVGATSGTVLTVVAPMPTFCGFIVVPGIFPDPINISVALPNNFPVAISVSLKIDAVELGTAVSMIRFAEPFMLNVVGEEATLFAIVTVGLLIVTTPPVPRTPPTVTPLGRPLPREDPMVMAVADPPRLMEVADVLNRYPVAALVVRVAVPEVAEPFMFSEEFPPVVPIVTWEPAPPMFIPLSAFVTEVNRLTLPVVTLVKRFAIPAILFSFALTPYMVTAPTSSMRSLS